MNIIELTPSLEEVNNVFCRYKDEIRFPYSQFHPFFRGLSKSTYKLYSRLSRYFTDSVPNPLHVDKFESIEQEVLLRFKEKIDEYHKQEILVVPKAGNNSSNSWYLLLQMQHLEIPTRMMDWTWKENLALYFAVSNEKKDDFDGVVWGFAIHEDNILTIDSNTQDDPFTEERSLLINLHGQMFLYENFEEKLAEKRILRQGARFFFQNPIDSALAIDENAKHIPFLTKFIVPKNAKKLLRKSLEELEEVQELKISTTSIMIRSDDSIEKIKEEINKEIFQV